MKDKYYIFEDEEVGLFAVAAKTIEEAQAIAATVGEDIAEYYLSNLAEIDALGLDVF